MGSSKKHKEKHKKKEKKRRRSRSRSPVEQRRSPSPSSRSPVERRPAEREYYSGKRTEHVGDYGYNRGQSFTDKQYRQQTSYEDIKIKVEPTDDVGLSYAQDGRTLDAHDEFHTSSSSTGANRGVKREPEYEQSQQYSHDSNQKVVTQRELDERNRDRDYQNDVERYRRAKLKEWKREQSRKEMSERHREAQEPETSTQPASSSGGDIALSIEETNKIRAQLGLKPLDVGSSGDQAPAQEKSYEDRDDVHQPAVNLAEQRRAAKVKERLEEMKQKRKMQKKLQKVKHIGVAEDDDDPVVESATAWVMKSRKVEKEKLMAEKRAKMLEEMDGEFGISGLAEQVLGKSDKKKSYSSRDLKGLRVEHSSSDFKDDAAVVLTLKDRGVLDEDEDVLENVNMVDDRKHQKNVENRKKRPDYRPYDESDDDAMFKSREVLEKYDNVIEGEQEKSFRLDAYGREVDDDEQELERVRENLRSQQVSLQSKDPKLALDYYTTEEMVKFNKPKKKRKVRKREAVKADDLIPMGENIAARDHGSRKSKGAATSSRSRNPNPHGYSQEPVNMDISDEEAENAENGVTNDDLVDNDEAELELKLALQRSRKLKLKDKNEAVGAEKVAQAVLAKGQNGSGNTGIPERKLRGTIILDSTSEFCRTLGEVPNSGPQREIKEEQEDEDMMYAGQEYDVKAGGWSRVYETKARTKEEPQVSEDVLDAEPIASHGVASALNLAVMKGYLEVEKKKEIKKANYNFPETKAYIDEEKMRDDDRDRHHRYDPYGFKEKEGYKPDIKLEYVDESGRLLTPKEAFRYLSHKFHGKGSGKMKTEKRAKKQTEEARLEQMSAIDTPLGTVKMMSERQKQASTPYVVLSGGGKNLLSSETISKK